MTVPPPPSTNADDRAATAPARPASTGTRADHSAGRRARALILGGATLVLLLVVSLYLRAAAHTNHVALASKPRPVSVRRARSEPFRPSRSYVGTLQPWAAARVGPQVVSAYLDTVLVRPGSTVKRGDVLATLDCRSSSAEARAVAARAQALEARQKAISSEARRVEGLAAGGFSSQNDAEQLRARAAAESSEIEGMRAALASRNLAVSDCVLRAPFAGEISERLLDPGAWVRPGTAVASVIDRGTVRLLADAPESDFAAVAPGTPVTITVLATAARLEGRIARRAPAADESTRTIHFEVDLGNRDRALPVGTTATVSLEVGEPARATTVLLPAATVRGDKATLFVVDRQVALRRTVRVLGERDGRLFLEPGGAGGQGIAAGTEVVVEGRGLLEDGDAVAAREVGE